MDVRLRTHVQLGMPLASPVFTGSPASRRLATTPDSLRVFVGPNSCGGNRSFLRRQLAQRPADREKPVIRPIAGVSRPVRRIAELGLDPLFAAHVRCSGRFPAFRGPVRSPPVPHQTLLRRFGRWRRVLVQLRRWSGYTVNAAQPPPKIDLLAPRRTKRPGGLGGVPAADRAIHGLLSHGPSPASKPLAGEMDRIAMPPLVRNALPRPPVPQYRPVTPISRPDAPVPLACRVGPA